MIDYWRQRIAIVGLIGLFFLSANLFFANNFSTWIFIILSTYVLSFTHFLIGGWYQYKAIGFQAKPKQRKTWFFILMAVGFIVSVSFILFGSIPTFFIAMILYFSIHSLLNEITLFEKSTDREADKFMVAGFFFMFTALVLFSLRHISSAITPQFEYLATNDLLLRSYLDSSASVDLAFWLGIFFVWLAVSASLVSIYRSENKFTLKSVGNLGIIFLALLGIVYVPHFVYIFTTVLLYHFIVWFWFYFRKFKARGKKELNKYLIQHLLVVLFFLPILFPSAVGSWIDVVILNSYVTLTMTMMHITASFLGEPWFNRIVTKL